MGVLCGLTAVPKDFVREILDDPDSIPELVDSHRVGETVLGLDRVISLEKSWHCLHFVLTGSAWEGEEPLNFLVSGGEVVAQHLVDFGPARLLHHGDVARLARMLDTFDDDSFRRAFNPKALAESEIYPQDWDEPLDWLLQWYGGFFRDMKAFVRRAADRCDALVVSLA